MEGERLPELGLVARSIADDFRVEELTGVEPSGSGEHVLFGIEKRGIDTLAAIGLLARKLAVSPSDFGRAGLKDARAVTRQALSVRHPDAAAVLGAGDDELRVLWAERHDRKLRPGQLAGNRFTIRLRPDAGQGLTEATVERVRASLARLGHDGLANAFGPQRLGPGQRTARVGLALLRGEPVEAVAWLAGAPQATDRGAVREAREAFAAGDLEGALARWPASHAVEARLCAKLRAGADAGRALASLPRGRLRLHRHAAQSLLFQRFLERRADDLARLLEGDVVRRVDGPGTFRVEDPQVEQPRSDRFEIAVCGPLFGRKLFPSAARARELELEILAEQELAEQSFAAARMDGDRRPLRVRVREVAELEVERTERGEALVLGFELPPGSYATSLLAQL